MFKKLKAVNLISAFLMEDPWFGFQFMGTIGGPTPECLMICPELHPTARSIPISSWELGVQFVLTIPADAGANI